MKCCVHYHQNTFKSKFNISKDKHLLGLWDKFLKIKLNNNSKINTSKYSIL